MKIHYLSDIYFGKKNAGTTHTMEIYTNLSKKHDIHLICQKPEEKIEVQNKLYIPVFGTARILRMLILNVLFWIMYPVHFVVHNKPDVLYQRFDGSLFFSPALVFSKIFKIPLVMEVNGLMLDEIRMRDVPTFYLNLIRLSEKIYYQQASQIIVVTEGIKKEITNTYAIPENKIKVINNGVNTEKFKPMEDENDLKAKYNLENKKIVMFVGIFVEWQGLEYLIESAPKVIEKRPDTIFLLVGDGPLKERLVNKVEKNGLMEYFIFTGFVPHDQVPSFISISDVCVVPKKPLKSGYSPLKLYEYMASGKSIIATRTDGFEILEKSKSGILINPKNSNQFSNSIVKLLQNESLRKQMGENGRRYVIENFSWKIAAIKIEQVLNECSESYRRKPE
jgi:glycosyltransferase involved in cell wall biosynthesis